MEKPWEIDTTVYADEAALLAGLRGGEPLACTCLMKRFAPRLHRVALGLIRDVTGSEDAVQETFIRACAGIGRFEGRSGLGTWLHRILRNTVLMDRRRMGLDLVRLPEPEDEGDGRAAPVAALVDRGSEPETVVAARELGETLGRAVQALPTTLRAAVVLRDVEGRTTQEAATSLGIAESALKVRLHRARRRLRAALAADPAAAERAM